MGHIFLKPLAVSGQIDGADWTNGVAQPVDMDMIADNFRAILSQLNGGLHGSNIAIAGFFSSPISDINIQFPEYVNTELVPVVGNQHSHNGIDSAFLGVESIDMDCTDYFPFGTYMHPSKTTNQNVYSGRAEINVVTPNSVNTLSIKIPFDNSEDFSVGRVFAQVYITNPSLQGKISNVFAKINYESTGTSPFITAYIIVTDTPKKVTGLFIDWVIFRTGTL